MIYVASKTPTIHVSGRQQSQVGRVTLGLRR
jgi:hypothetical protein